MLDCTQAGSCAAINHLTITRKESQKVQLHNNGVLGSQTVYTIYYHTISIFECVLELIL